MDEGVRIIFVQPIETLDRLTESDRILVRFLPVMKYRRKGLDFLRDFIQERLDGKLDENGQKPHDLVQWLIDAAPPIERTIPQVAERVMALNVASIHTSTLVSFP